MKGKFPTKSFNSGEKLGCGDASSSSPSSTSSPNSEEMATLRTNLGIGWAVERERRGDLGNARGLREEGASEDAETKHRVCGVREREREWSEAAAAAIVKDKVLVRFLIFDDGMS